MDSLMLTQYITKGSGSGCILEIRDYYPGRRLQRTGPHHGRCGLQCPVGPRGAFTEAGYDSDPDDEQSYVFPRYPLDS